VAYATRRPQRVRRLALFPGQRRRRSFLGNPDIRVPDRTKSEDGLRLEREEEDEQNAENAERRETDDGRRNGNSVVPWVNNRPAGKGEER
ncbi:hypothetical protein NDU88_002139, partial [Pleurodeles waltl]